MRWYQGRFSSTDQARTPAPQAHPVPVGIKLVCVLGVLGSLISFVPVLSLVVAGGAQTVVGLILFSINVGTFIIYYGLLTRQRWAYIAFLTVWGLYLLLTPVTTWIGATVTTAIMLAVVVRHHDYYH